MLHSVASQVGSMLLSGLYTIDTLPDPSQNLDMYARVTDLFGGKRDLVLASQDQYGSYWQPVRPTYKGSVAVTTDLTLQTLKQPSVLTLVGAVPLGVTRKIGLSNNLAYPGASFVVRTKLSSLVGALQILDGLNNLLTTAVLNSSYTYYFDPLNGWETY